MNPADPGTVLPRRRALRLLALAAGAAVAAGAAWGGWHWWSRNGAPQTPYIFATVQRGDIEDLVTATGSLQPREYVDVGAQVSGQLTKIHVEVGSEVKEGQLLAEIDAEQAAARVEANRASLRAQRATLAQRQAELEKAERDWQRQKNLMAEEATTAETLQNAETTVLTTRAQIENLKAQIAQAEASMRVEETNLKFTKIYAPMAGTVASITARQGQTLNANQSAPTILRVADLSTMTVQTQVSEADVSKLRSGMPVYFTTLGSASRRWHGTLAKVEPTPTVTNNVVLYNALFDVPNPGRSLMTQMTAQVFFVAAQARDVLMVPMSALTLQRGPGPAGAAPAAEAGKSGQRAVRTAAPPDGAGAAGDPGADGGRPRPDRQAWQNLSEAERERMRAERRAARAVDAAGGPDGAPGQAQGPQAPGSAPRRATVKVAAADGSLQEREVTVGVSNRVHAEILSGLQEGEKVVAGMRQSGQSGQAATAAGSSQRSQPQGPGFGPGVPGAPGMGPR